ncbi:hypothetical protein M1B78_09700 [Bacteroides sp. KH569_7]|uniref:Uncharacterized protein n=1 Tax=Bacteroides muris (ex Fokt et al. 2023) TaxID=2937417 RepID=A0A9X2NYI5_9BACE|nr:hypothetical protein [Bacteroides muris (ex Fokt et al. 2023)]MCR6508430.1 hypothetical protein [Bacteroides muris (ex Fokt et al. 2023)]
MDSTSNLLQLSNIAELNTQIGAERLKMENIQATSRYRITLFSIVTGLLLLSLLFLMLYLHRKRKVNLELCHKNEELSEARDQAEAANKADNFGQGTGPELNICRLIAERLKGKVLPDKEYKEGARFVFVLPVEEKNKSCLKT